MTEVADQKRNFGIMDRLRFFAASEPVGAIMEIPAATRGSTGKLARRAGGSSWFAIRRVDETKAIIMKIAQPQKAQKMTTFRRFSEREAGVWANFQEVRCDKCGYLGKVKDSTKNGAPAEMIARKFRQLGWDVGRHAACPKCVIEKTAKTREGAQTMQAEAPREPTVQDRRRIREALDEHYIEAKGCYRQSFSDKSLAAKLSVPAKWVSDLREMNGYGPDKNEEASLAAAEIAALRKEHEQALEEFMRRADAIDARIKKLEVKASYAA